MLYRKIESAISEHFTSGTDKILIVTGARQIGKSYIIRHVASRVFKNFLEINLIDDAKGEALFERVHSIDDFYMTVGAIAGSKLGSYDDTIIFLNEIQQYPHLLTMLKFLREDHRYHIVVSGSLLGISLKATASIPIGSITIKKMYPLDFEEFLIANDCSREVLQQIKSCFKERKSLPEVLHTHILGLFKRYLLVGGMPDAVNEFLDSRNVGKIREIQDSIHRLYALDASQYDIAHRLKISAIYKMLPSLMENKKKRLIFKDIEGKPGVRSETYIDEIDYLISSGVALGVNAVSNPSFPLPESGRKNLLKLYLSDVGMLTALLYRNNFRAILDDDCSVNLGSVYECVVAMELAAHGNDLFYYDNKKRGEVDYIIDDYETLSATPIEIKSGKDYTVHSAITQLTQNADYRIGNAYVLSNAREVKLKNNIWYMPIYYISFFDGSGGPSLQII